MSISLHKDLGTGGWHSSLMTTYSVDPTFYDTYIERRLRRNGCENNLLLADAAMLTKAIEATPAAFRLAGRRYAVIPIVVPGCFHPKIHLRFGSDKARLIVGSANATAAGWCRNLEVLAEIDWSLRGEEQQSGSLIRKAYDYFTHWIGDAPGEVLQYKRRLLERESPWLRDLEANKGDVELADGSAMDLFCEHGGDSPSIVRRLAERVVGEKIRRLVVISPYWDANLHGLHELHRVLSKCPIVIALDPEKSAFPINFVSSKDDFEFVRLKADADQKRFPHAKVILVETTTSDHVVFGSANCSDDALGLWAGVARNAEVSVYRRLKPGTVITALGLDLEDKVDRDLIACPTTAKPSVGSEAPRFDGGFIELTERVVTWYPPKDLDALGAKVRISGIEAPVALVNGRWRAEFLEHPPGPLIAHVVLKSGEVSRPIVVHDESDLRRAAPGHIDSRLRDTFKRIRNGEEDLIDLALHAHMIFAPESTQGPARTSRRGVSGHQKVVPAGVSYASPEEFRRAMSLQPATGVSGRFSVDDPELLQVLSIVRRGSAGIGIRGEQEAQEEEDDRALAAGDTEDGDEQPGEDHEDDTGNANDQSPPPPKPLFKEELINRRRRGLVKAMDAFQELLVRVAADPSLISNRLAVQTTFMIQLMVFACTKEHRRETGASVRLMVLFPFHPSEREYSFALRVARMLKAIWLGKNNIARHVFIDASYDSLPDDMVAWVVWSRWAIARAYLAGKNANGILLCQIGEVAKGVYVSTAALGPISSEAEESMMRELDASIGATASETEELKRYTSMLGRASAFRDTPASGRTAMVGKV